MVIELASLRVKHAVNDAEFGRAADRATAFLSGCQGFIRRRLAKSETGDWVDYVEWESRKDALSAAARFNHVPESRSFNEAIEPGSVMMRHLVVHSAVN
jgi:heme-degrading monooxygenase HmoA